MNLSLVFVVVACSVIVLFNTQGSAQPGKLHAPVGQLVDVGNRLMHIYCIGGETQENGTQVPSVILEAGLPLTSLSWYTVLQRFNSSTDNVRVCAYDRSGYAWSENGPNPRDGVTIAKELHELLYRANVSAPYLLVGHSFGGAVVRLFASLYPDQVSGLVLVDATSENTPASDPGFVNLVYKGMAAFKLAGVLSHTGIYKYMAEKDWLPEECGMVPSSPSSVIPTELRTLTIDIITTPKFCNIAFLELYYIRQTLQQVSDHSKTLGDVPLVVLRAGQEDDGEKALQEAFLLLSKNSKMLVAENSDHYINYNEPEKVVEAVKLCLDMIASFKTRSGIFPTAPLP